MRKLLYKPYKVVKKVVKKATGYNQAISENQDLKIRNEKLVNINDFGWPNGHYYSPVHSLEDLKDYKKVQKRATKNFASTIPGFSDKKMVEEFNDIKSYFKDFDYPEKDEESCRFYTGNVSFPTLDAVVLSSMIRKYSPENIVEVGSGFTSGLMMEVNERHFKNKINITFVEPYPYLLTQRMKKSDKEKYKVIPRGVQEVSLDVFKQLKKDDILFIDSTHVSKFNSDVNYEIFDILPVLNKGVIIHFHDVFNGLEYPLEWLEKGWAWNEDYLLRAFLMNNNEYEILLMNDYLSKHLPEQLTASYSKQDKNILNGGSLWLKKI